MKLKIFISWTLVILWMIVIFLFSNMPYKASNDQSQKVINKLVETTIKASKDNKKTISKNNIKEIVRFLNKPLRKCAHASVFFVLAILFLIAFSYSNISNKYLFTLLLCFLYALSDEFHQLFVFGRSCQFSDVLIDTIGSSIGLLIFYIFNKIYIKCKVSK